MRGNPLQTRFVLPLVAVVALAAAGSFAAEMTHPTHLVVQAATLAWGPAPPVFEPGAQLAVVMGDPGSEGPYVVRAKLPAGYKIMSHWHPTSENVTVLSGSLGIGAGDKFDKATGQVLATGGFVSLPALMHHYAWTEGATEIQIHGLGPLALFYVNPADDPQTRMKPKS